MTEINFVSLHWDDNNTSAFQKVLNASDQGKYQYIYQQDGIGEFDWLLSTDKLTQEEVEEICGHNFDKEKEREVITLSTGTKIVY